MLLRAVLGEEPECPAHVRAHPCLVAELRRTIISQSASGADGHRAAEAHAHGSSSSKVSSWCHLRAHALYAAVLRLGILAVHVQVLPPGHGIKVANSAVHLRAVEQASMLLVSIPPLLLPETLHIAHVLMETARRVVLGAANGRDAVEDHVLRMAIGPTTGEANIDVN